VTRRISWLPRWSHRADRDAPSVVVFVDVAASVALYRRLGDALAASRISTALDLVGEQAAAQGGELIKRSGDELLLLFGNPERTIDALIEIQNDSRLNLRIGAHRGAILRQHDDIYGDTVNLAARLTAIARARQIVLSRPLFESLEGAQRSMCERFQRLRIKGVATSVAIYQLRWEGAAATAINTLEATQFPRPSTLVLELVLDGPLEGSRESPPDRAATTLRVSGTEDVLIGRDPSCDLIIDHPRVSRFHATVESHDGQFLLRDHSTNGSVLQTGPRPLRRATVPLRGQGAVSFGHTDPTYAGIPRVTFMVA
jgi:adenylate cyclase